MRNKYDAFTDKNSLSVKLKEITQQIYDEYKHQKEREEDREYCIQEVLKRINYEIVDNATPAIEKIAEEINKLIK